MRVFFISVMMLFLLLFTGCGSNNKSGGTSIPPAISDTFPATISVSETMTSKIIKVDGFTQNDCIDQEISILVGGEDAPVVIDQNGTISFYVPLFYDESLQWTNPPAELLDIEYLCDGVHVAINKDALVVKPLIKHPNTTALLLHDFKEALEEFGASVQPVYMGRGPDQLLLEAAITASIQMIEEQMQVVAGNNSPAIALLDAVYYENGYHDNIAKLKELMTQFRTLSETIPASNAKSVGLDIERLSNMTLPSMSISDERLALKMQKYVVMKEYVDTFLHGIVTDYKLFATILKLIPGLQLHAKAVETLQSSLAMLEFMLSKFALSSMPATLEFIKLTVDDTTLKFGEITSSKGVVKAVNAPSGMSINDWVGLVVTSVTNRTKKTEYQEKLLSVVGTFITYFNKAMSRIASSSDGSFRYDMTVSSLVPPLTWEAEVSTPKFYKMGPISPASLEIIHPDRESLEWEADDDKSGEVPLYFMTSMSEDARLITSYEGGEYLGGAFGLNSLQSNVVQVTVKSGFAMDVDVPECIPENATGYLYTHAGNISDNDDIQGYEYIKMQTQATGGQIFDETGAGFTWTDENGDWSRAFTADEGAEEIQMIITATDPLDSTKVATKTVTVKVGCEFAIDAQFPSQITRGNTATLRLTIGDKNADGTISGIENMNVSLNVTGGFAQYDTGHTDANGVFEVIITPDSDASQVEVIINATNPARPLYSADATVSAEIVDPEENAKFGFLAIWEEYGDPGSYETSFDILGDNPYDDAEVYLSGDQQAPFTLTSGSSSVTVHREDDGSISADLSANSRIAFDLYAWITVTSSGMLELEISGNDPDLQSISVSDDNFYEDGVRSETLYESPYYAYIATAASVNLPSAGKYLIHMRYYSSEHFVDMQDVTIMTIDFKAD